QAVARSAARMAALAGGQPYGLIYERYSLFSAAGAALAESSSAPLILEVNAPLLSEQSTHRSLHDAETAHRTTVRSFAAATLISCVSEPVADWARRVSAHRIPAGAPQVVVTPNAVNTERFSITTGRFAPGGPGCAEQLTARRPFT